MRQFQQPKMGDDPSRVFSGSSVLNNEGNM